MNVLNSFSNCSNLYYTESAFLFTKSLLMVSWPKFKLFSHSKATHAAPVRTWGVAGQRTGGTIPGWDLTRRPPSPFLLGPASSQMLGEKEGEKKVTLSSRDLDSKSDPSVRGSLLARSGRQKNPPSGNQMRLS